MSDLKIGDRVKLPGIKVDIYGSLVDIRRGKAVVTWDNGVTRNDVVLRHLRKA
jgi:hypothetical protein